ncbi:MAG TPA: FAD-binding oxidoreductase [Pirellulales bacterium]|nr:FAD-binding oxidoreductase [Pirellulales bacterium]
MPATADSLPLTDTLTPAADAELAQTVREAFADGTPIYPIGGGTSLNFGLPARHSGLGLSLQGLKRVIDYPARDMTVTVEAGLTLDVLTAALAKEKQRLPIDLPDAHRATLGGVIATNTSGARRYAQGTLRDYVIGIAAVDGRGTLFHGGGRVVKNVAGYDFCKLLTGSLGTLGIITQVTLRVKPLPEFSRFVACRARNWETAERLLEALVTTQVAPAAIELLAGPAWSNDPVLGALGERGAAHLLVGLEGTEKEVQWMSDTLWNEWRKQGAAGEVLADHHTAGLWMRLAQFPVEGEAPLVIKAAVRPSRTVEFTQLLMRIDPNCSIQAHAGNGVVIARLAQFGAGGVSKMLVSRLQPAAAEFGGHVTVLSCATAGELTRQCWWGALGETAAVMDEIKRQFDPKDLLNRGRFVYAGL